MALLAVLLAALLAGCAGPAPEKIVVYAREPVPVELSVDCPTPAWAIATNGELAQTALAYRAALKLCNEDKASLRLWGEP